VLLVVAFTTAVRIRLADVPLERDEGEYAYAGRLILGGVPPYKLAYNMKFPGTYYAYAAILAAFGETARGVHLGLAVVNAATTWLMFRLGRRLLGDLPGVVAAAAFALLSLDCGILGVWAHATHFVVLFVVAGLLVLLRAGETGRRLHFLAAGALLGVAVLMKQHAVLFVAAGVVVVIERGLRTAPRDLKATAARAALVGAGSLIPVVAVVAYCATQGVLGRFWFWTFTYAAEYVSETSAADAKRYFIDGVRVVSCCDYLIWALAGVGFVALWIGRRAAGLGAFVVVLSVASVLAICPGFYFRPHYFVLLLPAAALLVGVAVLRMEALAAHFVSARTARVCAAAVFVAAAAHYVVSERAYLFTATPDDVMRSRYQGCPFIEAPQIARYIRERTGPDDRIAVLGSEPEIYFYADRIGATGYIYTYAMLEPHPFAIRMRDEMIREIEEARPTYLVACHNPDSWSAREDSDLKIFAWVEQFAAAHYDLVGIVDIPSANDRRVVWDDAVAGYGRASPNRLLTFRRKDAPPIRGK
jgi:hypothetical protein